MKTRTPRYAVDFSYAFLERLLTTAAQRFEVRTVAQALKPADRPVLVARHDIDISLDAAVRVAELEARLGLRASYLVLVDWPLYDIEAHEGREALRRLVELGHDVGLHVDRRSGIDFAAARDRVADAAGAPVRSMSYHRPTPECFHGPPRIAGMVNAYSPDLMRAYISDSRGRFRVGDPVRALQRSRAPISQLLIHPVWWGQRSSPPTTRLRDLVRKQESELGTGAAHRFAQALAMAVPGVAAASTGRLVNWQ